MSFLQEHRAICQQYLNLFETYYLPAPKDFVLTGDTFIDPNKRFAAFEDWLDCDKQDLISFVPQEIAEVQQKIAGFLIGCGVKVAAPPTFFPSHHSHH